MPDLINRSPPYNPPRRLKVEQTDDNSTMGASDDHLPANAAEERESQKPPTKRARKAINCEPCRASKLKCDRSVCSFSFYWLFAAHSRSRSFSTPRRAPPEQGHARLVSSEVRLSLLSLRLLYPPDS